MSHVMNGVETFDEMNYSDKNEYFNILLRYLYTQFVQALLTVELLVSVRS